MKKLLIALSILVMFVSVGWMQQTMPFDSGFVVSAKTTSVSISKKSAIMIKGTKLTLKISGTESAVTWKSSDKTVAAVNSKGKVTAKAAGAATIVAKVDGKKYTCAITVEDPKLNRTEATLVKGQTLKLKLSGTKQKVAWSSSNKAVATVTSKGVVSTIAKGVADVTATVGKVKFTCKVTVETPKLSKTALTLEEGNCFTLKVKGTTQTVKWSSSDKTVATVKNGTVTAVGEGTANIVAAIGSKKYTCKLTVTEPPIRTSDIKAVYYDSGKGIIGVLTNKNKNCIDVEMTVLYYDKNGKLIDNKTDEIYALQTNWTAALHVSEPFDFDSWERLGYSDYKVILKVEKSYHKNADLGNKFISVESTDTGKKIIATVTNTSGNRYEFIHLSILYYNEYGQVFDSDEQYVYCQEAGSTDYINFDYPYDENYDTVIPASYKVIVDYAY